MTPALYKACKEAAHVITPDGQILRGGRASLFVLREINFVPAWMISILNQPPFIWFVELGYRIVANNRQFFSKILFTKES